MEPYAKTSRVSCGECQKRFVYRKLLNEHIRNEHLGDNSAEKIVQNNLESIVKSIRFKCAVCNKGYVYRRALHEHIRLRHPNNISPVAVNNEEQQIREINAEETRLRCTRCSKSFIYQRALNEHIRRTHPDLCIGTENNENKENMLKRDTADISFNFEDCSESFMLYDNSDDHVQKSHAVTNALSISLNEENISEISVAENKHFKRGRCKKRFKRNDISNNRFKVQHSVKKKIAKKIKRNVQCDTCGISFFYRKSLIRHIQDKHPEQVCGENPLQVFECPICYCTFQYRFNLNQHFKRQHSSERFTLEKNDQKNFECNICKVSFHYRFNLTRHILKKHTMPEEYDKNKILNCRFCDKRFRQNFNLSNHIQNEHPKKWKRSKKKNRKNFICATCGNMYTGRVSLIHHIRQKHSSIIMPQSKIGKRAPSKESAMKRIPANRLCPLCRAAYVKKSDMLLHFCNEHGRRIETKTILLENEEVFVKWKHRIEDETKSKYVKYNCYKSQNQAVKVFICHRSGCFQSRSRGLRHLRLAGSEKINGYCPAEIKLTILNKNNSCVVEFTDEHVGHGQELQFLKLQEPRESMKYPADASVLTVLDDLLEHANSYNSLTKCSELSPEDRQLSDAIVLTTWLNDNHDSVLFFKGQEDRDETFKDLNAGPEGDFVLIIMNEFQVDMFKQYGSDIVAINRMEGPYRYGLELSIVMVLDNFRQGIPCCFLLSNRNDQYVYEIMFSKMAQLVGEIRPKVFMSHVTDVYANAWNKVMPVPERRILCSWHVLRLWEKNLSKVRNVDTRKKMRDLLYTLRMELNPMRFHQLLQQFLRDPNEELTEFQEYFKEHFLKNVTLWAYCYRKYAGINTNYVTERFFRAFRQMYLSNKSEYTFEEVLDALSLLLKNLPFEKIMREVKGKLVSKLKHLRERHKECMKFTDEQMNSIQSVEDDEWYVPSFGVQANEVYHVERVLKSCDCKLRCYQCKSCLHQYRCSCLDNCIQYNMCTHIHQVCMLKNKQRSNDDLVEEMVVNEIDSLIIPTLVEL